MSEVIDRIKQQYPQYADTPDDQLTLKVAEKYPTYLDRDPQFKEEYQQNVAKTIATGIVMGTSDISQLTKTLTSPAAGAAAAAGRQPAPPAETVDTIRPMTTAERFRASPLARAILGEPSFTRKGFEEMGPVEGLTHQLKVLDVKPKDIVEAARQFTATTLGVNPDQLSPKPTDESVAQAMHENKGAAFAIGAVKGLEDLDNFFTSPLGVATLGTGALPKLAQRLVALGFAAQMGKQVPEIATQLGDEMGKPEDQRDYQKIGNLVTQAATATGFTVMGVLHGAGPGIKEDFAQAKETVDNIAQSGAPKTAEALAETGKEANAIQQQSSQVLRTVQTQPGESPGQVSTPEGSREISPRRSEETQQVTELPKTQQQQDYERYTQLVESMQGAPMEQRFNTAMQMESIKNRYGGFPPKPQEVITHAAFVDPEGNVEVGANHPEILDRLGVEGFGDRNSRNTPNFGYRTNLRSFITREEAGPVATAAGQNLEQFDPGEPVHSDQIASPADPSQPLGDVQNPPELIGMGGAVQGEIPEVGGGGDIYGIAQRYREERARAGQVAPIAPGEGVNTDAAIQRGLDINNADPRAAEQFMREFENDPQKRTSFDQIASIRAHGYALAVEARRVESRFGTSSPEYEAAKEALTAWDKRTKPVQTEWSKQGQAQQAATDLDTGSVIGLERERIRNGGESFTPEEKATAEVHATEVRETETGANEAETKVTTEIEHNASPEDRLANEQTELSNAQKVVTESDEQIAAAKRAIDAANKVIRENAIRKANAENKQRVKEAKTNLELAKQQRAAAEKIKQATLEVTKKLAVQMAKTEREVKARKDLMDQAKAAQKALQAAHRTVRENAARLADAENKERAAKTENDRAVAKVQADAARKAQEAVWRTLRENARRVAKIQRQIIGDGSIPVWEKARQYLEAPFHPMEGRGTTPPQVLGFDDLRNKIASDLGMSVEKVTRLLARSNRMKYLTDDLWIKKQRERNAKTKAKLWVQGLDMPAYRKFIRALPRALFALRVGFHGTVALGTHAPAVAFDPRFWGTYVRNFGKMYHMVYGRDAIAFYEGQMQDLMRRPNFPTAVRGGLVVDPNKFEDFKHPGFTPQMVENIKAAYAKATGLNPEWFTKMGSRGYSVLKILRMDMFDQHWNALPRHLQTADMAEAISDAVNHITGIVRGPSPKFSELIAFAPKLQFSRAAFLVGDPVRAAMTAFELAVRKSGEIAGYKGKLPKPTPEEVHFAKMELKSKLTIGATFASLLALNQGILMMSGSKQKVNFTDPLKSDFGKFKVAGLNVSYGNPMITMARLPGRVAALAAARAGKFKGVVYPDDKASSMIGDYFRSQFSPFASLIADQLFREDYQRRQLWNSNQPEPKRLRAQGIEPYTPAEYWTQQALPIPFQEVAREWQQGKLNAKSVPIFMFNFGAGGRAGPDYEAEKSQ